MNVGTNEHAQADRGGAAGQLRDVHSRGIRPSTTARPRTIHLLPTSFNQMVYVPLFQHSTHEFPSRLLTPSPHIINRCMMRSTWYIDPVVPQENVPPLLLRDEPSAGRVAIA